jgi:hypothetical protein
MIDRQWGSFLSTPQPHAAVSFEIGGNFKPDENSVLIVAVPDTKSNLTVTNPDFVRLHRKYANRYVVIVILNKYKKDFYFYGRRQGNGCEIQFRGLTSSLPHMYFFNKKILR